MWDWHILTSRHETASNENVSVNWDVPVCVCVYVCVRACVRAGVLWCGTNNDRRVVLKISMPVLASRAWGRIWCLNTVGSETWNWTGPPHDNYHSQHGVAQPALLLGCKLDRRVILVRLQTRARYFLWSKNVQTSSGANSALYSTGTWVLSPRGVQLTHHLHIKTRLKMRGAIHHFHPYACMTFKGISFIRLTYNPWTWVIRCCCTLAYWRHCKHKVNLA